MDAVNVVPPWFPLNGRRPLSTVSAPVSGRDQLECVRGSPLPLVANHHPPVGPRLSLTSFLLKGEEMINHRRGEPDPYHCEDAMNLIEQYIHKY